MMGLFARVIALLLVVVVLAILLLFVWASITGDAETADRSLSLLDKFLEIFGKVAE